MTIVDNSWHRLRHARLAGIPVYFGQVLSESAEHSIEFNQIAYLLAATDNDAFNALVCTRFGPELGRSHVFQLPSIAENDPNGFSPTIRGQILGGEVFYEDLVRRYFFGWRFTKTRITEEYTYDMCVNNYQPEAMEIVIVKQDGSLAFRSTEKKQKPKMVTLLLSSSQRKKLRISLIWPILLIRQTLINELHYDKYFYRNL